MNIVIDLPKPKKVRADSLEIGDAFAEGDIVYVIISSNPDNLEVLTKGTKPYFLPRVLVDNLSTSSLGWLNRGTMVVPVELELIVSVKE